MNRYNYNAKGSLVVHYDNGLDNKIYGDAIDLIKELDEQIYVYENTPFAHWHERALRAEEKVSLLQGEVTRLYARTVRGKR